MSVVGCDVKEYISIPEYFFKGMSENIIVFPADGGNHFTHWGIYEGTYLFIDLEKGYQEGKLSCFKNILNNDEPRFKLSEEPLEGYEHFGRVVMTLQKLDDGNNSMRYI